MRSQLPLVVLAGTLLAAPAAGQQPQTFRSGTTLVTVNVSVRLKNLPVGGLRADDFELTDNGVHQQIADVAIEAVPVDVTLILDTSGSMARRGDREKSDARKIAALLAPGDRYRLLTIDTYVHQVIPLQHAGTLPSLDALTFGGVSSSNDALAAALMQRTDVDRRHLIVAMTDGRDNMSALDVSDVRALAERSDAVLHVVLPRARWSGPAKTPTSRYFGTWMPFSRPDVDMLREVARESGGEWHTPGRSTVEAFTRVYQDFQRSYLLRYTPSGVDVPGWHDIGVNLRQPGGHTVRARKGYDAERR